MIYKHLFTNFARSVREKDIFYKVDVVVCWQDLKDDEDVPLDVESATL
jgi:hypothetical protein